MVLQMMEPMTKLWVGPEGLANSNKMILRRRHGVIQSLGKV